MKQLGPALSAIVLACLLAACGGSPAKPTKAPTPTQPAAALSPTAARQVQPTRVAQQTATATAPRPTTARIVAPGPSPTGQAVTAGTQTPPTVGPVATTPPSPTDAPKPTHTVPPAVSYSGMVMNRQDGKPVAGAWVYLGNTIARSNSAGKFSFKQPAGNGILTVLAPGYAKFDAQASKLSGGVVKLEPFDARGVYLPFFAAANPAARERIFDMIKQTTLNAVVVDVKSDDGFVWKSNVPLAHKLHASQDSMDLKAFTTEAHKRGIYVIGRFVCFKDNTTARGMPQWAAKSTKGSFWLDWRGTAYVDPFQTDAWKYFGDLAVDIAKQGVDEIQYDYVRFPVDGDLSTVVYKMPSNPDSRTTQITAYLEYMQQCVKAARAFDSADIFGLTVWSHQEQGTGQVLENVSQYLDFVSPMLYPSGFAVGSDGYKYPTEHPYELTRDGIAQGMLRLKKSHSHALMRPFLQSFTDYAFGKPFALPQFLAQRRAAEQEGTSGWLYWNPAAKYDPATFR